MFCPNCGNHIENGPRYCSNCGMALFNSHNNQLLEQNNRLNNIVQSSHFINNNVSYNNLINKTTNKKIKLKIMVCICLALMTSFIVLLINKNNSDYYFSSYYNNSNEIFKSNDVEKKVTNTKKSKYQTSIVADNTYSNIEIYSNNDAYKLIEKDSISQKVNCPSKIIEIENEIIQKYNITAVNLCEMDVEFAKELERVFEVIYRDYPSARGYITNLTLRNTNTLSESGVIAAFMPMFSFATSNSSSTYPWVIKTQVLLSSQYFLNKTKLEASVKSSSTSGHFPPNSTVYSPVAHELGHYLSFLAMMKYYNLDSILLIDNNNINSLYSLYSAFSDGTYSLKMINEAYQNFKKDTNTSMNLDEWRGTISGYALAKNNSGDYIYDETIAEAFHDVYLNGNNAKAASKYIVEVLKQKLES